MGGGGGRGEPLQARCLHLFELSVLAILLVVFRISYVCCDVEEGHEVQRFVVMLKQVMRCRGLW